MKRTRDGATTAPRGVHELLIAYRSGEFTPIDAVERCLKAITELDGRIGAFQEVFAEEARAAAKAATEQLKAGMPTGRKFLFGVPFALKDIVDLEGKITTAGCAERVDYVAGANAEMAERLLAAGGILIGKVKTVEFAMGSWGTNERMGTPRNPWDAEVARVCGGSSSGSGAAVAAGMVPCAVGTDTGGSVRLPASLCGIVGLKTTERLLPTSGIVPLSHTLDTVGPMARCVEDAAVMFRAMMEPRSTGAGDEGASLARDFSAEYRAAKTISGVRLACMGPTGRAAVTDAAQLAAFDRSVQTLRSLGAEVTPFDWDPDALKEVTGTMIHAEGYYNHAATVDDCNSRMDGAVRARLLSGKSVSASTYIAAMTGREAARKAWLDELGGRVAWLSPTTACRAIELDAVDESTTAATFTRGVNYLGLCAVSVPTGPRLELTEGLDGLAEDGLPTSLQIVCPPGREATALGIAHAYEAARGPLARPPLSAATR